MRHTGASKSERTSKTDVHDQIPICVLDLPEDPVAEDACIVEEDVDPPGLLDGFGDNALDVRRSRDVGHRGEGADGLGGGNQRFRVRVHHPDRSAGLGKPLRGRLADAAGSTRHDHRLAGEVDRGRHASSSRIIAIPCPPPTHIVSSP